MSRYNSPRRDDYVYYVIDLTVKGDNIIDSCIRMFPTFSEAKEFFESEFLFKDHRAITTFSDGTQLAHIFEDSESMFISGTAYMAYIDKALKGGCLKLHNLKDLKRMEKENRARNYPNKQVGKIGR